MDIQYLKNLDNNKIVSTPLGGTKKLQPISLEEIVSLEEKYNNKKQFPIVLREMLYIAGQYCYLLDYGNNSQDEIQRNARLLLAEFGKVLTRPFYVIDVYYANDQFLFVYLDEDQNDPVVYEAFVPDIPNQSDWISNLDNTLTEFINTGLQNVLNDLNPF
jgi:hypothetical protein